MDTEGVDPEPTEIVDTQLAARYTRCLSETAGTTLDLSRLGLAAIPPEALAPGRFPKLRTLNLRRNRLSRLPEALAVAFPLLATLDVSENQLEELPAQLGVSLARLERLVASDNQLRALPTTLARLEQLQELRVRNNRLEALDEALGMLPRLQLVDLGGNEALADAPERLRRLHERNLLLHSRAKRRELVSRALRVRAAVAHALVAANPSSDSPGPMVAAGGAGKSGGKRNTVA